MFMYLRAPGPLNSFLGQKTILMFMCVRAPGPLNSCLGDGETTLKITLRCDKNSGEQRDILKPRFPRRFLQRFGRGWDAGGHGGGFILYKTM